MAVLRDMLLRYKKKNIEKVRKMILHSIVLAAAAVRSHAHKLPAYEIQACPRIEEEAVNEKMTKIRNLPVTNRRRKKAV